MKLPNPMKTGGLYSTIEKPCVLLPSNIFPKARYDTLKRIAAVSAG
jgi:hypothetical protein